MLNRLRCKRSVHRSPYAFQPSAIAPAFWQFVSTIGVALLNHVAAWALRSVVIWRQAPFRCGLSKWQSVHYAMAHGHHLAQGLEQKYSRFSDSCLLDSKGWARAYFFAPTTVTQGQVILTQEPELTPALPCSVEASGATAGLAILYRCFSQSGLLRGRGFRFGCGCFCPLRGKPPGRLAPWSSSDAPYVPRR